MHVGLDGRNDVLKVGKRKSKSNLKTILIILLDMKCVVMIEWVRENQTGNQSYSYYREKVGKEERVMNSAPTQHSCPQFLVCESVFSELARSCACAFSVFVKSCSVRLLSVPKSEKCTERNTLSICGRGNCQKGRGVAKGIDLNSRGHVGNGV